MRVHAFFPPLVLLMAMGCAPRKERIPPPPETAAADTKFIIYQLTVRLFGNKLSFNKPFGTITENGVGKFNDITPRALEAIRKLGISHVWYTGVLEHPTLTDYVASGIPADDPDIVKGRAGSPYTVKDYYDIDPDLADNIPKRMEEFEQLIERTHNAGLKAIIDFVPNHVARRYKSDAKPDGVTDLGAADDPAKAFSPTNNFYYLPGKKFQPPPDHARRFKAAFPDMDGRFEEAPAKATGDDKFVEAPPADSWFESIKLNYGVDYQNGGTTYFEPLPDTWLKMREILLFWTGKKVDGFRCDVAEKVPVAFWRWVIPQVKAVNPDVVFIAEIYEPARYAEYAEQGRFDFLYDKVQLYDTLRLLINGKARAQDIARIRQTNHQLGPHLLHFLENHDEQRIASTYFAGNPFKALPGMLVSTTLDAGPAMIYFGQEVGEPGAGTEGYSPDDGRTTMFDYWGVPEHQKWMNDGAFDGARLSAEQVALRKAYQALFEAVVREEAIRSGDYADLTVLNRDGGANDRVVAFTRFTASDRLIVVAGFNARAESIAIRLSPELADGWKLPSAGGQPVTDLLGDTTRLAIDRQEGLRMTLPPYGTRIWKLN